MFHNDRTLRIVLCLLLCVLCCQLAGCATLWTIGNGFGTLIYHLVMIPVKALSKIVDIANKLPRPPPGVF